MHPSACQDSASALAFSASAAVTICSAHPRFLEQMDMHSAIARKTDDSKCVINKTVFMPEKCIKCHSFAQSGGVILLNKVVLRSGMCYITSTF